MRVGVGVSEVPVKSPTGRLVFVKFTRHRSPSFLQVQGGGVGYGQETLPGGRRLEIRETRVEGLWKSGISKGWVTHC